MVNIDTVYQKVLALSNKEQRGYITPQEFNLLADRVQNEIFENYFHNIKMTEQKPKNETSYADELEVLEAKLHDFHINETVTTSTSALVLPATVYKIIDITRGGNRVTEVSKNKINYTENNPLTKASTTRSVFVRIGEATPPQVTIYPAPTVSTSFEVNYYKKPSIPRWAYVVVNEKALYNSNTATNFSLHPSEEEALVSRILMLAGLAIKQPEVMQAGAGGIQMTKQEQNS